LQEGPGAEAVEGAGPAGVAAAAQAALAEAPVEVEEGSDSSELPALSPFLKRLALRHSGNLRAWAHVCSRLPALECLEVMTPALGVEAISYLPEAVASLNCLTTLRPPNAGFQAKMTALCCALCCSCQC
jgi:hypothetical protein